jgi:hypothetical protein
MELSLRLYAHVYVKRAIQRTFVAHDARSHTYNRERGHIHPYVYADISNTNTRACLACIPTFIPVHNAIVHIMHTTAHSCEQAMYCTHMSVWSVELWASAAAMCCAPSSPMECSSRLFAHVCEKSDTAHVRERGHIHPCIHACPHTKYKQACMPCTCTYLPTFQCTTQ